VVERKEHNFFMTSLNTINLQRIFSYIDDHQQGYLERLIFQGIKTSAAILATISEQEKSSKQ